MNARRVRFKRYGVEVQSTVEVFGGKRMVDLFAADVGLTPTQARHVAGALMRAALWIEQQDAKDMADRALDRAQREQGRRQILEGALE